MVRTLESHIEVPYIYVSLCLHLRCFAMTSNRHRLLNRPGGHSLRPEVPREILDSVETTNLITGKRKRSGGRRPRAEWPAPYADVVCFCQRFPALQVSGTVRLKYAVALSAYLCLMSMLVARVYGCGGWHLLHCESHVGSSRCHKHGAVCRM